MRARKLVLALMAVCLVAGEAAAADAPHVHAPRDRGLVLGSSVECEVGDADTAPDIIMDGAAITTAWTALPYPRRWVTRVPIGAAGPHTLTVSVARGPARTVTFTSVSGKGAALEAGDSVARHFLAQNPTRNLKWTWNPAVFLYGLHKFAQASSQKTTFSGAIADYYTSWASQSIPSIDRPDVCAPALGALALDRVEKNGIGMPDARVVAHYLNTEPRDVLGAIDHLGASSPERFWANLSGVLAPWAHSIWVDSLMMYGVFAVQWGSSQGDTTLRDFGAAQPGIFAAKLQDRRSGLFTHAWDWKSNAPLGVHWLRGNGWVGTSVVEMLSELAASHPKRAELEAILSQQTKGLLAEQMANGLWDSILDKPGASYAETSGSLLVAYALAKGARLGILSSRERDQAKRVFEAITARLERRSDGDLSVTGTSEATNATPAWVYPLIPQADDVDYGVGAYLLLAAELAGETF